MKTPAQSGVFGFAFPLLNLVSSSYGLLYESQQPLDISREMSLPSVFEFIRSMEFDGSNSFRWR
jgi:hypothetical protein